MGRSIELTGKAKELATVICNYTMNASPISNQDVIDALVATMAICVTYSSDPDQQAKAKQQFINRLDEYVAFVNANESILKNDTSESK